MLNDNKKKVLMILPQFPPSNDVGSYRGIKFIKNLARFGWYPVVLAPSNGVYNSYDHSAEDCIQKQCTIIRTPMLFPFGFLSKLGSKRLKSLHSLLWKAWNKIAIPDGVVCWIPMALLKARKIIREQKIEVVFASGAPFSVFIITGLLKLMGGGSSRIKIVIDYRDPWTLNPFTLKSGFRGKIERALEIFVLQHMDVAVLNTEEMRQLEYQGFKHFVSSDRLFTVTNSFEELDSDSFHQAPCQRDEFVIVNAGNFYGNRGPEKFFEALSIAASSNAEFAGCVRVRFYGLFDKTKLIGMANKFNIQGIVDFKSRIPQSEIIPILQNANLLIMINGYGPGHQVFILAKFFDYLKVRRPILCLSEEGALSKAVRKTRTGVVVSPVDPEQIARELLTFFKEHKVSNNKLCPDESEVDKYNASYTTKLLCNIFDTL